MLEKLNSLLESHAKDYVGGSNAVLLRISDRPDLSDFQANGAFQLAKLLKKNPKEIASEISAILNLTGAFEDVTVAGAGFVNVRISDEYVRKELAEHSADQVTMPKERLLMDYGGPNVAKPLHVGHLRSAIIGQALKGIARHLGHEVISDVHLGDWGTPMGMLIAYLEERHPEWPYFADNSGSPWSTFEPRLTEQDLNSLYPLAASRFREDTRFAEHARVATAELQRGRPGYLALWRYIVDKSVAAVRVDFARLGVDFDLWHGESEVGNAVIALSGSLIEKGIAVQSDGAEVIDVSREDDSFPVPPLILRKRDGAVTYATTDLATIAVRVSAYRPDKILYIVDKRQSLHFTQVFRAAARAGLATEDELEHIGFGTMNGKDGKPFKTREGGVMRLSALLDTAETIAAEDANVNLEAADAEIKEMVRRVALGAIKFGDLSNVRTTDYVFDIREFTRFEGRTGPYLQYTAVRAASLLHKAMPYDPDLQCELPFERGERNLAIAILLFPDALRESYRKRLPSHLCDYVYGLANQFNAFYHECPVLNEPDPQVKSKRLYLIAKANDTLRVALKCLGIPVPDKMLRSPLANR